MEIKMEAKIERIIVELKKARDAQEPEKSRQFAANFERLGDYFVEQSETQIDDLLTCHRTALKAISLYNLALASAQLISDDQTIKKLLEKIHAIENAIIERSGGKPIYQSLALYEQEIEGWKKKLHSIRSEAKATLEKVDLGSPEVQTIYKTIAAGLKLLVKDMIESFFKILPLPNDCVYSIITLGSLAREEATPYSDFEWAILIENPNHKEYFRRLTELLWIKVINLGETTARMMDIVELDWFSESDSPCRKGFSFDGQMLSGCHTPLGNKHHTLNKIRTIQQSTILSTEEKASQIQKIKEGEYELIGTQEELAQFQTQRWGTKRGFCTVLSTVAPIISNNDHLVQDYEKHMAKIWNFPFGGDSNHTLIQQRSLTYLNESIERFKFQGGHFGKETHYFDAKYHLYRLPNMLIDHASSYFSIQPKNLWDRLEGIFGEAGIVHFPEKSVALKQVVSQVLGLRLRAYLKKRYRDDHVIMFDSESPEKNEVAVKKYIGVDETILLQIYSELIELQWRMESFIEERGASAALAQRYGDVTDFMRGEVHRLLLNYPKAAVAFEKAKRVMIATHSIEDNRVAGTLNNLGMIYHLQDRNSEAIVAYEESKRITIGTYGPEHLSVAETLNNLGVVYEAQRRYPEGITAFEESKRIMIAIHGPDYVGVASPLNNLGVVYRAECRYSKALAAFEEAKRITIATFNHEHLGVAETLNNIGAVYSAQGRCREAAAAYEEAKRIKIASLGPKHPSVAVTLNNLGVVYKLQARYREAIAVFEEAKRIMLTTLSPEHPYIAETLCNKGLILIEQGLYEEARALFKAALIVYKRAQHPNQEITNNHIMISYIREGNVFMLQKDMDSHRASSCYQHVDSSLDPDSPESPKIHEALARKFYDMGQLTPALEHYSILIRLGLGNASAYHNLACIIHARACIELSKGEVKLALDYIKEAEGYFERAIQLTSHEEVCTDAGVCTEYALFLWKNRDFYGNKKIIALLQQAIALKQLDKRLSYGRMERSVVDQYMQILLDQENHLSFKAYHLAHYLLIQVYCAMDQLPAARALCRDFQAQVKEDEEAYEITQIALCAQFSDLMEADPDKTKHYEEQLRQQSLANEKQQRLHARLVECSKAEIKRVILSQIRESKQPVRPSSQSPRLFKDSLKYDGEAVNKKIESVQKTVSRVSTSSENQKGSVEEIFGRHGLFTHEKKNASEQKAFFDKAIPEGFRLSEAKGKGDCFYDSCAQELYERSGKNEYTIKSLRLLCHEYAVALDKRCNGNPQHPENWIAKAFNYDTRKYHDYLANVRYTVEEREAGEGVGDDKLAIWGEQHIDGRILSEKLGIKLHVIEVRENPDDETNKTQKFIVSHNLVDEAGLKNVEEDKIDWKEETLLHIAVCNLHFVPILKIMVKQTNVTDLNIDKHNREISRGEETMEFKMETNDESIITKLKEARDAQEPEKSRRLAAGFEALGDNFVEQSETQKDNLLICHRTALKAISLYNLALSSAQFVNDDQTNKKLLEKIQAIEKVMIERSGGKPIHQNSSSYEQEIEYWKRRLQNIRAEAKAALEKVEFGSPEIQSIYKTIAAELKLMVKDMIESCFKILPLPNDCVYSIITLGSLAREEATPYSDFEWAILIENPKYKNNFRRLSELLWIKVINLGETTARMMDIEELNWFDESESPCKKGFSFDGQMMSGCHTPLGNRHHTASKIRAIEQNSLLNKGEKATQIQKIKDGEYELIGTPEELAQFQTERWETKRGFCTVLSTVAPIICNTVKLAAVPVVRNTLVSRIRKLKFSKIIKRFNNSANGLPSNSSETIDYLVQHYEENMRVIWNSNIESNPQKTLIQQRSLTYLAESVKRFEFKGGYFGKEMHYFDAKYHLYRLPNMLIDHIASYFGIQSTNLWDRVENIFGKDGVVNFPDKSKALKRAISQVLGLRLKAYLKKGYRDDHILMFDPQNPEKNQAAVQKYLEVDETLLIQIYSELIELEDRTLSFIEKRGTKAALKWDYGDMRDFMRGEVHFLLLNYSKAALAYEEAKRAVVAARGVKPHFVADVLINLGGVYKAQYRYPEAIVAFEEGKRVRIDTHGSKHPSVAQVLLELGNVYQEVAQYPQAIEVCKEAKRIIKAVHGSEHLSMADVLINLGIVYQAQSLYSKAVDVFEKAKRIKIAIHGPEHHSVADTLNNLGMVYQAQSLCSKALVALEESKRIKIATYGPKHLSVSSTLNNLGIVYQAQARYLEALAALEESKRIEIAIHGPGHSSLVPTLTNLGMVYKSLARNRESAEMFEEVIRIVKAIYGPTHITFAIAMNNLGKVYQSQSRYLKALAALEESKQIMIDTLGPDHFSVSSVLINLGGVYQAQFRYPEAIALLEKAIQIRTNTHQSSEHPSVAEVLFILGRVYLDQIQYPKAIEAFTKAEGMFATLDPNHLFVAHMKCYQALVFVEQQRYMEARRLFDAAIKVYELAEHHTLKDTKSFREESYLREVNFYLLKEPMDTKSASVCYSQVFPSQDHKAVLDPKTHQDLANKCYGKNKLTAALESYRILIRLAPDNVHAHHNLACLIHVRACIEQSKGEDGQAMKYIKEAEGYFERAIQLDGKAGVCTEYAQFLWKNRDYLGSNKVITLLQQAIDLKQLDKMLSYGLIERFTLDQYLQCLLDQENKLSFKAYYLAHYLLIKVYCVSNQLEAAQKLFRGFQIQQKADKQSYPSKKAKLLAKVKKLIQANPDKTKHYEEELRKKLLADEKLQRLHPRLVAGSQAAIERCVLSQLYQSANPIHTTTLDLLYFCSALNIQSIPEELLLDYLQLKFSDASNETNQSMLCTVIQASEALIQSDGEGNYCLHPVTRIVINNAWSLDEPLYQSAQHQKRQRDAIFAAAAILSQRFTDKAMTERVVFNCNEALLPHVDALLAHCPKLELIGDNELLNALLPLYISRCFMQLSLGEKRSLVPPMATRLRSTLLKRAKIDVLIDTPEHRTTQLASLNFRWPRYYVAIMYILGRTAVHPVSTSPISVAEKYFQECISISDVIEHRTRRCPHYRYLSERSLLSLRFNAHKEASVFELKELIEAYEHLLLDDKSYLTDHNEIENFQTDLFNQRVCARRLAMVCMVLAGKVAATKMGDYFKKAQTYLLAARGEGMQYEQGGEYENTLGMLYCHKHNPDRDIAKAERYFQQVYDQESAKNGGLGKRDFVLADAAYGLAVIALEKGDIKTAREKAELCISMRKEIKSDQLEEANALLTQIDKPSSPRVLRDSPILASKAPNKTNSKNEEIEISLNPNL
ncbi:MAG: tetratricopeptide repeat protein [Gammaproteobacteria bacterium]|nr:tetratricopeptide repeat protein [Gammaproteobacteria bacterium]